MKLEPKGDFDDNPKIPEDYYISLLDGIRDYERDESESRGLILDFRLSHEGEEVVLPFFAPAKLSVSRERESSRLAENLENIGLLETVLDILDESGEMREAVMSQKHRCLAKSEDDADELIDALKGALAAKKIRVNVEDGQQGDESQISKLSRIFEGDEDGEDRDAIFDEDEDEESESDE